MITIRFMVKYFLISIYKARLIHMVTFLGTMMVFLPEYSEDLIKSGVAVIQIMATLYVVF